MSLSDTLQREFDLELKDMRAVLERLPENKLDWRPQVKSWTMAVLATHPLTIPHRGTITLETESFGIAPDGGPPPSPKVIHSIAEGLARECDESPDPSP